MELSVVTTIYNDSSLIHLLVEKIRNSVSVLNVDYEIILVNDCSPDDSEEVIKSVCEKYTNVKGVSLSRNYGQQIAMSAGMRNAKGNYVVIMDGDLQNPPEKIPELYNRVKEGYDLVYTTGTARNSWRDELSSRFFWWILSR